MNTRARVRRPRNSRRVGRMRLATVAALALSACDRSMRDPAVSELPPREVRFAVANTPADPVMGSLAGVARAISAGLQDPAVRHRVAAAMKERGTHPIGIDLRDCAGGTPAAQLVASGAARLAANPEAMCDAIRGRVGMVLYMDGDRLTHWDSSTVPIVTAIDNPDQSLPASFLGFRSPDVTVALPADGSLRGPILVVLPLPHDGMLPSARMPVRTIQVPNH